MTTYFASVGSGIGDVIVCLPICKWLIEQSDEPVVLVARGPRQLNLSTLIPGISGEIIEPELQQAMKPGDRLVNLRDHPLQMYYDWFSDEFQSQYPNFYILDILSQICADKGISADLTKLEPFSFKPDNRATGKVLLVPGSTMKAKMLNPQVWVNLKRALGEKGVDSVMLGLMDRNEDIRELADSGIRHIETPEINQAIDLISSARAMVSVDTGLMHIAVQQGIRTIAIHGKCEVYHRPAVNCLPIFTNQRIRRGGPTNRPTVPSANGKEFPVLFNTWNWHPIGAQDGEYLAFNDHDRIMTLLFA